MQQSPCFRDNVSVTIDNAGGVHGRASAKQNLQSVVDNIVRLPRSNLGRRNADSDPCGARYSTEFEFLLLPQRLRHFATCRCHCRNRLLRRGIAAASDWLTIGGGVGIRMSGPHVALCARISATPGFTCPSPSGVCSLAADSDSQLYGVGLVIMASLRIRPTPTCSAVKLHPATRNACCAASCHIGKTLTFLC